MTRAEWQRLAEERLLDAQALLAAGRWSMAYYTVGYVVECGLKSCILARLANEPHVIFEDKRFSEKCWIHEPEKLVDQAGLKVQLDADCVANPAFGAFWTVVKWSEEVRYQPKTQAEAEALVHAVADPTNGVLQWMKVRW